MDIKLKELSKLGYTDDQARSIALQIIKKHLKHNAKHEIIELLVKVKNEPQLYYEYEFLYKLADIFGDREKGETYHVHKLDTNLKPLRVYGSKEIDHSAKKQMEIALSLPIAVQGALMPDAHTGYGMPIGGVLAAKNVIIPYAIGVDIGCRMAISIFDEADSFIPRNNFLLKQSLREKTHFGMEGGVDDILEHEIMDRIEFQDYEMLRRLKSKAYRQLGSSGSGNHFVEWGSVTLYENNEFGLPAKNYVALLSHSGSRGLGAHIAQYYIRRAMDVCHLPTEARSLSWLDLDLEDGMEYWNLMNFAGDYAAACHDNIHKALAKSIGMKPILKIENHHNFAWKETIEGHGEVIVHRKGATPAHKGELGIIPGSMTSAAYLVRGLGVKEALNSASHGAGRAMSRQRAKENMTNSAFKKLLAQENVHLIGGSVEENPFAYKDIEKVMQYQKELVVPFGKFMPKIVRMNRE
jgi:tRNA-splicing ligase RtcB (3'-phosphate/5'-hydroxy nucleic acid ligase)